MLIEAAWSYRLPARVSNAIAPRHRDVSKAVVEVAWKAQVRLCQRFRSMCARRKHINVVATAIARELACFVWAIARFGIAINPRGGGRIARHL